MNLVTVQVLCFTLLYSVHGGTINRDQVQPFDQPNPVTISEKAAVKFKPQFLIGTGCVSFPAVNAAGEITGGLKGTKGTEGCEKAPLGSQVYGRAGWYQDKWAMVYAWYFPKNLCGGIARKRHDWASMVLWIDNPALETLKILGVSLSQQTLEPVKFIFIQHGERKKEPYKKMAQLPQMAFVGTRKILLNKIRRFSWNITYGGGSNVSTRVTLTYPSKFGWVELAFSHRDGTYEDLIMWKQLTTKRVTPSIRQISVSRRFFLTRATLKLR